MVEAGVGGILNASTNRISSAYCSAVQTPPTSRKRLNLCTRGSGPEPVISSCTLSGWVMGALQYKDSDGSYSPGVQGRCALFCKMALAQPSQGIATNRARTGTMGTLYRACAWMGA